MSLRFNDSPFVHYAAQPATGPVASGSNEMEQELLFLFLEAEHMHPSPAFYFHQSSINGYDRFTLGSTIVETGEAAPGRS